MSYTEFFYYYNPFKTNNLIKTHTKLNFQEVTLLVTPKRVTLLITESRHME